MTKANPLPSQAELDELLSYEPLTGVLRWKVRSANCVQVGDVAGGFDDEGYRVVGVNHHRYLAHRVIWMMAHGFDPAELVVDHRDNDRANNRLANLRLATIGQNRANACSNNQSGLPKGVHKKRNRFQDRFQARINVDGVRKHLGMFDTPELAHEAYCVAAQKVFGEFWRAA